MNCTNNTKTLHHAYAQPHKCKQKSFYSSICLALVILRVAKGEPLVFWSSLKKITSVETNLFVQLASSVFCSEPGCDQLYSMAIIYHPLGDKPGNPQKSTLQMQLQPAPVKLTLRRYAISKQIRPYKGNVSSISLLIMNFVTKPKSTSYKGRVILLTQGHLLQTSRIFPNQVLKFY